MNEYDKIINLAGNAQNQELITQINSYISELKADLRDEKHNGKDLEAMYNLSMKTGKIAAIFRDIAMKSDERYLFNAGYMAALVEEYKVLLDKLERISEYEDIYSTIIRKAHRKEIIDILYRDDTVQNKDFVKELGLKPNQLNPIMHELERSRCIVEYSYSKYKYYTLTWHFKKYLESMEREKPTISVDIYQPAGEREEQRRQRISAYYHLNDRIHKQRYENSSMVHTFVVGIDFGEEPGIANKWMNGKLAKNIKSFKKRNRWKIDNDMENVLMDLKKHNVVLEAERI